MKRVLKWIGIVLGGLVGLVILAILGLYASTAMRLNKTHTVQAEAIAIPKDSAAIERGRRWASIYCAGCHGDNLAGTAFFEDPGLGRIPAPNLTAGKGGVAGAYSDADWVRAIRHGVRPDGKPLLIMPAQDFYYFSDGDLGDIIAYVKSVLPVDAEWGRYSVTPLAHVLVAVGAFGDILGAEVVDHTGSRPSAPPPGVTVVYGDYLIKTFGCRTCHGKELAGGKDPNPAAPLAPNLTPGGGLKRWSEADFLTAAHTRVSEFMPWKSLGRMTDDELKAIWLYLQSLPAKETQGQ